MNFLSLLIICLQTTKIIRINNMEAGKFTNIIDIYKEVITEDEYGTQKTSYQLVYTGVRASKEDGNLFRQVINDNIYSASTTYFLFRDAYEIKIGYFIKYKGDMYRVNAIKEMKSKRVNEIVTELFEQGKIEETTK